MEASEAGDTLEASGEAPAPPEGPDAPVADLEHEGDVAADYLEGLLDILDLDGDIDLDVEGDRAQVAVVPDPEDPRSLDALVGGDGSVLEALQDLTRLAVARETGERSRLMLDVAGFRLARRAELAEQARRTVEQVKADGAPVALAPMSPFERKVVHDAVAAEGLRSASEGAGPTRHVVVHLA